VKAVVASLVGVGLLALAGLASADSGEIDMSDDAGVVAKPKDEPAGPPASPATTRPGWTIHRLYFRAGVDRVSPLASSRELELADVDGAASLAVQNGPIAGSGADVSASTILAIIVGYTLPVLHDRLALETILGAPLHVKFTATGTLANQSIAPMALGIPTGVPALGPELGEADAAPPLLTVVYKLRPVDKAFIPFVGAGASVLIGFNAKVTNSILTQVSQPTMTVAPAPGFVMQAGFDLRVWKNVYARFDIKYIAGMLARARVEHILVKTPTLPLFDTVEVGTAKMSVWVNPLITQLALGYDF
jgi:outer membrane protein W